MFKNMLGSVLGGSNSVSEDSKRLITSNILSLVIGF